MENIIPTIKQGVRTRKEDFGALVFTNRTPILSLNEDSYLIWSAIDGERTIVQITVYLQDNNPDRLIDIDTLTDFYKACEDLDLIEFKK